MEKPKRLDRSLRVTLGAACIALLVGVFFGFAAHASRVPQSVEPADESSAAANPSLAEGADALQLFRYLNVTETIPAGRPFDATGCVGPKGYDYAGLSYSVAGVSVRDMSDFVAEHPNYLNMASWNYAEERIVLVEMRAENLGTEARDVSFRPFVLFAKNGKGCEIGPDSLVMQEMFGSESNSGTTHEKGLSDGFFLLGPGEARIWTLPFVIGSDEWPGLDGLQFEGRFDGYHRIVFELE